MKAPRIRVLVVDDSAVARRYLCGAISGDPDLEAVGTASSGVAALEQIARLAPDVVTMDIEMPEMSGLEALAAIRRRDHDLPVIMVSSLSEPGAPATLEALSLGATDYLPKPARLPARGDEESGQFVSDLLAKIRGFGARRRRSARPPALDAPAAPTDGRAAKPPLPPRPSRRVEVVAIGASTGGPNALGELLREIPAGFPVPILIVQHMPPVFTRLLAERLATKSSIQVREAKAGDCLVAGAAFIAPGDHHMTIARSGGGEVIALHRGPRENSCRPSVDVLFRSVGDLHGPAALAVVMTGMGEDGLRGCEWVRKRGGQILVQDEETSVVWGMPRLIAEAGLADQVLGLGELASAIVRRARAGRGDTRAASGWG